MKLARYREREWWSLTLGEIAGAVAVGLLFFAMDWSGFNKWEPSLFTGHRNLADIWWHLPILVVGGALIVRLSRR